MRITFETVQEKHIQGGTGAEKQHQTVQGTDRKAERAGAFAVSIGNQEGRMQKDGTYKKENLTAEEISMQAGQMDIDIQKMYMAVMSNSMSQDEFNRMLEDGVDVSDVDIETMVTILDQIRVAVAKGGGDIAGFTDGLSKETLEEILGSSAYAEALESGLDEGAVAYMVEQQKTPTAENIYRAKYSAGACQGREDSEIPDMNDAEEKGFWDQIDRVISEAGLPAGEEGRKDALFLLRHDIPLTEENLRLYEKVKVFGKGEQGLSEEELKYRIAMQVCEGKAAKDADLSRRESIYELAEAVYRAVQEMTPETVRDSIEKVSEGKELTLKDLMNSQKEAERTGVRQEHADRTEAEVSGDTAAEAEEADGNRELLTARRQLEEVRLRMTIEANIKLLRSGFQIDTAPMEQLIERLKSAEEALAEQGISRAAEAVEKINELRGMPAYTLGFVVSREISFTVEALYEKGGELQADFGKSGTDRAKRDAAKERYETMQTEVRADLGDSIRKAFRNVDDILTDMNREPSEENRRAVRMLGYNRLEITEENLDRALELDEKVQDLFRDMTPGRVLKMIRDGVDVLHTDIGELNGYLREQKNEFVQEGEDFARFLYKLDKNGAITTEERESYIGIYRLIRQVERSDGKAEGYLLGSEAQLTMANLLAAVRSGKRGYMDYAVDESFSGVDAMRRGKNIIDQINAASYESSERYEETMQVLEGAAKKGGHSESEAADFLREMNQPVTVSNLLEASAVLQEDAGIYQRMEDYDKEERQEDAEEQRSRLEGYVEDLQDSVGEESSLREGMELFAERSEKLLREAGEREGVTELDIRDMQQICRGIRFRAALSRESRYQIPVKTDDGYTVMNLTVRRGTGEARAEISVETEEYGRLEAVFTRSGMVSEGIEKESEGRMTTGIRGSLFAETENGEKMLTELSEKVGEKLRDAGISADDITVMRGSRVRREVSYAAADGVKKGTAAGQEGGRQTAPEIAEETGGREISTGELYQIAKIFLETIRK